MRIVLKRFLSGDPRTVKIKKNIIASAFFKGVDILIYLVLVPLTLGYLNAYEYGIWLTLNSILLWINSFDIGLGNGLRNKLAIAVAKNDLDLGRKYVSTTFFTLLVIMLCLFGIVYWGSFFINWYSILNVSVSSVPHLGNVVLFSFACFCLNFVFKFVGNVYLALQLPAITSFLNVLGHGLSLVSIWGLTKTTNGSLLYVAVAYSISPVIVYILAYPITFSWVYRTLAPSVKWVRFVYLKDLMGIGLQFFFLQIAGVVLFASSNIIISRLLGPENVTPYNIAYRYFSVIPLIYTILITPMWSAVTDAYTRGDMEWIKKSMAKVHLILKYTLALLCIMVLCSKFIFYIWIGNQVIIPWEIIIAMAVYTYIVIWSSCYSSFLNGIGFLRIQVINTVIIAIVFFPLAYFLINWLGLLGMVITMCLTNVSGAFLNTIQFGKIFVETKKSLWMK